MSPKTTQQSGMFMYQFTCYSSVLPEQFEQCEREGPERSALTADSETMK